MSDSDCSICYEAITAETGKTTMSCSHTFHYKCLTKWFNSRCNSELAENCPCCRHEASEFEMLPEEEDEDEDMDEEDSNVDAQSVFLEHTIQDLAARERAAHFFGLTKLVLSEDQFRAFAATKIAAGVRGFFARKSYADIMISRNVLEKVMVRRMKARNDFHMALVRANMQSKSVYMSRPSWIHLMATYIQRGWREHMNRKRSYQDRMTEALSKRLVITWRRTSETSWERIVLNPEERNAQTFRGSLTYLPPQSLAFESACAATKIAAVWRGHRSRKITAGARYLHMLQMSAYSLRRSPSSLPVYHDLYIGHLISYCPPMASQPPPLSQGFFDHPTAGDDVD